jgi:type 1 fimbria pilin
MKVLGWILLGLLLSWTPAVWAGPYLVSDPISQVVHNITSCELMMGTPQEVLEFNGEIAPATCETVGDEIRFKHDLGGFAIGTYAARLRWSNIWGSPEWSPPFEFTKAIPNPVSGIGLEE